MHNDKIFNLKTSSEQKLSAKEVTHIKCGQII